MSQSFNKLMQETKGLSIHYESFRNVIGEMRGFKFEKTNAFEIIQMEVNEAFVNESEKISNSIIEDPVKLSKQQ